MKPHKYIIKTTTKTGKPRYIYKAIQNITGSDAKKKAKEYEEKAKKYERYSKNSKALDKKNGYDLSKDKQSRKQEYKYLDKKASSYRKKAEKYTKKYYSTPVGKLDKLLHG